MLRDVTSSGSGDSRLLPVSCSLTLGKALRFGFKRQVAGEMAALPVFLPMKGFQRGRGDDGDSVGAAATCISPHKTMSCHAGGHSSHKTDILYTVIIYGVQSHMAFLLKSAWWLQEHQFSLQVRGVTL